MIAVVCRDLARLCNASLYCGLCLYVSHSYSNTAPRIWVSWLCLSSSSSSSLCLWRRDSHHTSSDQRVMWVVIEEPPLGVALLTSQLESQLFGHFSDVTKLTSAARQQRLIYWNTSGTLIVGTKSLLKNENHMNRLQRKLTMSDNAGHTIACHVALLTLPLRWWLYSQ